MELCEFGKMERRAARHGWKLVARTTNHNGVCPAHLGSIAWMQETRWHFAVPEHGLMLQIRYTEQDWNHNPIDATADQLKLHSYFELQCVADCSEWCGRDSFGDWHTGSGCYGEGQCDFTLHYHGPSPKSKSKCSVDLSFPDTFWTDWNQMLPTVKRGRLSLLSTSWSGIYGLPGTQTKPQTMLSYEFALKYFQRLGQTELPAYVASFSLPTQMQVKVGDHWENFGELFGGDLDVKTIEMTRLRPETQTMVDRVWQYVQTGRPDPNGLHDCNDHATHCVILGQGAQPMVLPARAGAEHAIPWHDVFDLNGQFKSSY
jgi:hypothetical protein